jgi:hypothetical protein
VAMEQRPPQYSYEDHRKMAMASRSFTGPAVITLVLYFIFWFPGLIANILFYKEAKEIKRVTGHAPHGMGCLSIMFWLSVIPLILLVVVIIPLMFAG